MVAKIVTNDGGGPVVGSITLAGAAVGTPVTCTNLNDTGVLGWTWALIDVPEPSLTLNPIPPPSHANSRVVVPDVQGHTILIRLTTYTDVGRTVVDGVDQVAIRVKFLPPLDWVIPAANETIESDTSRGWATEMNETLRDLHATLCAPFSTLIYRPAGPVSRPNEFTDFNALMAAFAASAVFTEIVIDAGTTSGTTLTLPAGAFNFDNGRGYLSGTWRDPEVGHTGIAWSAATTVTGLQFVTNGLWIGSSADSSPVFAQSVPNAYFSLGSNSGIQNLHASNAAFLSAVATTFVNLDGYNSFIYSTLGKEAVVSPVGATGSLNIYQLGDFSWISGPHAVQQSSTAHALSLHPYGFDSYVDTDAISAAISTTVNLNIGANSYGGGIWSQNAAQSLILGTYNKVNRSIDAKAAISAAGTNYATATQLPWGVSQTSTCAAGAGVRMPTAYAGNPVIHTNDGANAELLYPFSGDNLGAGVDVAITLGVGQTVHYVAHDATNWRKVGSRKQIPIAVAYAATLNLDVSAYSDFEIGALTGNCAITLINGVDGDEGLINVKQDGGGVRTVSIVAAGRTVIKSTSIASLAAALGAGAQTVYWYRFYTIDGVGYLQLSIDFLA